jgi:hypothetical protein
MAAAGGYQRPGSPVTWRWLIAGCVLTVGALVGLITDASVLIKASGLIGAGVAYVVGGTRLRGELPPRGNGSS